MKKEKSFEYCEFGKVIKIRLVELGKSNKWLADNTGTSPYTIGGYLRGKHKPEMGMLYKIATVLQLDFVKLVEILIKEDKAEK